MILFLSVKACSQQEQKKYFSVQMIFFIYVIICNAYIHNNLCNNMSYFFIKYNTVYYSKYISFRSVY